MRGSKTTVFGFLLGFAIAATVGFAVATDGTDPVESAPPAEQSAEDFPEPETPDPSEVTPVEEPNRVGTFTDATIALCYEDPEALGKPTDGISVCDMAIAVDQGVLAPGDELSNPELEEAISEVDGDAEPQP